MEYRADSPSASSRANQVYGHHRTFRQSTITLPETLACNAPNRMEGLAFLRLLPDAAFPACFFDPQYRGVLDKQNYGNEGARQKGRSLLAQMDEETIRCFIGEIARVLMPTGHLFFWTDKFHLCTGLDAFRCDGLQIVDLITWNKKRIGMGYRTRRTSEYLVVMQRLPVRAKGAWTAHDIPDVWDEKVDRRHAHAKPLELQKRLIEAVTAPGDTVLDPAAGSYSVLAAAAQTQRNFLGCDLAECPSRD